MPDIFPVDPRDPESAIAAAAKRCSNWGRWGADDVHGTLNFLDDAKRRAAASLVRRGASFSLAQSFDANGPQKGWRRRTNPVHTMLDTGVDAERYTVLERTLRRHLDYLRVYWITDPATPYEVHIVILGKNRFGVFALSTVSIET